MRTKRTSNSSSESLRQLLPYTAVRRALHALCLRSGTYSENGKPTACPYHGRVSSTNVFPSTHSWYNFTAQCQHCCINICAAVLLCEPGIAFTGVCHVSVCLSVHQFYCVSQVLLSPASVMCLCVCLCTSSTVWARYCFHQRLSCVCVSVCAPVLLCEPGIAFTGVCHVSVCLSVQQFYCVSQVLLSPASVMCLCVCLCSSSAVWARYCFHQRLSCVCVCMNWKTILNSN